MNTEKKDVMLGDSVKIDFDSQYYFGGTMGNANYTRSVVTQNYFYNAKDYADYQF